VGRHQLLAVTRAPTDQQRTDQARDAGIDMHHRATGEVDRAPYEDLPGISQHCVKLLLCDFLRGFVSRGREHLGGILDCIGAGPVCGRSGSNERHPSGMNKATAENFMRSAKAPTIRDGVIAPNVIWKQM
jgi:hypothetical protein